MKNDWPKTFEQLFIAIGNLKEQQEKCQNLTKKYLSVMNDPGRYGLKKVACTVSRALHSFVGSNHDSVHNGTN